MGNELTSEQIQALVPECGSNSESSEESEVSAEFDFSGAVERVFISYIDSGEVDIMYDLIHKNVYDYALLSSVTSYALIKGLSTGNMEIYETLCEDFNLLPDNVTLTYYAVSDKNETVMKWCRDNFALEGDYKDIIKKMIDEGADAQFIAGDDPEWLELTK